MISLPAAGQWGPLTDIVTYAPSLGALCGYSSLIGYPGEGVLGEQTPYLDVNSATHGAFAVMAALFHREQTGKGQYIDMAQIEVGASVIGEAFMEYFMNGRAMGTNGNRARGMAPHNNYPCRLDGTFVSIAVKTDEEWTSFCEAIGSPAWAGEARFCDKYNRLANQDELDCLVAAWTIEHSDYEVMETLQSAGVAAMPCLDLMERFSDPHFEARDVHLQVEHSATGVDIIAGVPFKMSETPCEVRRPAPLLGQHNDYVLGELLHRSKDEIAKLVEEGVVN
jgi:benzylsuccinate CoA-transferase BbsF subunit